MIRICVIAVSVGWVVLYGMGKLEFKLGRTRTAKLWRKFDWIYHASYMRLSVSVVLFFLFGMSKLEIGLGIDMHIRFILASGLTESTMFRTYVIRVSVGLFFFVEWVSWTLGWIGWTLAGLDCPLIDLCIKQPISTFHGNYLSTDTFNLKFIIFRFCRNFHYTKRYLTNPGNCVDNPLSFYSYC